jgi:hypothetical protein
MPTPPIYIGLPPGEELPPEGNGNSPTHPIYLPPVNPDGNNVLAHVYIAGYGGCWFLIDAAAPSQPPAPQPKK